MSGQLRVGVEELRWYGRGTCVRSARATAEANIKAWLARQAHSGIMAEAEHADDGDSGEFPGEVVGLVLEFPPHNEEQAWSSLPITQWELPPEFQAAAAAEDAELSSTEGLPEPEEQPTEEAPLIGGQVWRGTASPGDAADSAELSSTDDDSDQQRGLKCIEQ